MPSKRGSASKQRGFSAEAAVRGNRLRGEWLSQAAEQCKPWKLLLLQALAVHIRSVTVLGTSEAGVIKLAPNPGVLPLCALSLAPTHCRTTHPGPGSTDWSPASSRHSVHKRVAASQRPLARTRCL